MSSWTLLSTKTLPNPSETTFINSSSLQLKETQNFCTSKTILPSSLLSLPSLTTSSTPSLNLSLSTESTHSHSSTSLTDAINPTPSLLFSIPKSKSNSLLFQSSTSSFHSTSTVAKEEAAEIRRKLLENERANKLQYNIDRKKENEVKREQEKLHKIALKEAEREEKAKRICHLKNIQQAHKEELVNIVTT